jgi:hypothetical protein
LDERKVILKRIIELMSHQDEEIRVSCVEILREVVEKFQAFSSGDALVEDLLAS